MPEAALRPYDRTDEGDRRALWRLKTAFETDLGDGTGGADAPLNTAVELAREQDLPLERLLLDVDPDNERAAAFYRRHGFEPWGEVVAREL
jgi:GNAT superfamily N-acetyltransferase